MCRRNAARGALPPRASPGAGWPAALRLGLAGVALLALACGGRSEGRALTPFPSPPPTTLPVPTPTPEPREPALLDGVPVPVSERQRLLGRLPLAVVFDNHVQARPVFGIGRAELVYEVVAEGGISRLVALYWRNEADVLMPVRSARAYFIPWAAETDAIFVHFGGAEGGAAVDVDRNVAAYGVRQVNGLVLPAGPFRRDPSRAAPHNVRSSTAGLWDWAERMGWQGPPRLEPWPFKDDQPGRGPPAGGAPAGLLSFNFGPWNLPAYAVEWRYDVASNAYLRWQAGQPYVDGASGEQVRAKNVVVQFAGLQVVGDAQGHLLFQVMGEGEALVFQDGVALTATWRKERGGARTRYYDAQGQEIAFNRGPTWVEVLAYGSPLVYH